jgi:Ca-activated chloride channel family protein
VTFVHGVVFWLAWLVPAAVFALYRYDEHRRAQLAHRIGELPMLARVAASASPERRALKATLTACALTLIVLAIARPQMSGKRKVELRGLDVVVAVDVSKSMLVQDVGATAAMVNDGVLPTRLGRARELAAAMIDALPGDRVAPVVFAGAASHFPLTDDHEVSVRFLYDLGPADLPPGSNLAEVFRVARCLLRRDVGDELGCARIGKSGHGGDPLPGGDGLDPKVTDKDAAVDTQTIAERGKAIIVFTDGGDPEQSALHEVEMARELGIAVLVVGVGTPDGGVVHELDSQGRPTAAIKHTRDGADVTSRRDDAGMKAIAAAAGDETRYLIASPTGEVDPQPIVRALRAVGRGLVTKEREELRDEFEGFLFAAFMLLVGEATIATRRRQVLPERRA